MKIVHIITGLNNGGAEAVLFRLATGDKKNSHKIISLMDEGIYGGRLISSGIKVYTLDMPRRRVTLSGLIKLYRLLKNIRPDVVQTWMYHADLVGGIMARLAGIHSVAWSIRGPFNRKLTSIRTKLTIHLCSLLSNWIPRVIISNSMHAVEVHKNIGYMASKLVCIHNGYSLENFQPNKKARSDFRTEINLDLDFTLIGMVARFDPYKDHENLFAALSILSKKENRVCCVLIGSGMVSDNQYLVNLIEKYGVHDMVKLLGPRGDIPEVMAALDLHVLSSVDESFPNVLAEAMACGIPCITTDVGEAALIVGDSGWTVPRSSPVAMAGAIGESLVEIKNLSKWDIRKGSCRKRILENYTLVRMIKSYNKHWEGLNSENQ